MTSEACEIWKLFLVAFSVAAGLRHMVFRSPILSSDGLHHELTKAAIEVAGRHITNVICPYSPPSSSMYKRQE
jgi:hypothetical protein